MLDRKANDGLLRGIESSRLGTDNGILDRVPKGAYVGERQRMSSIAKTALACACLLLGGLLAGCEREQAPEPADVRMLGGPESAAPDRAARPPQTELSYELTTTLDTGIEELGGIAIDDRDRIYVAGANAVKVMDTSGKVLNQWRPPEPAWAIAVDTERNVYVGLNSKVLKYDENGRLLDSWGREGKGRGELRTVTDIAVDGVHVYVADAGNRVVHHFDATGDFIEEIGEKDEVSGNPGLVCPSPYLDCDVDEQGRLYVTNPGRLRVEIYGVNAELVRHWGEAGTAPERFCGCCNPVSICLMPGGRTATAEKGIHRVKIYDPDGRMLAFLGEENFSRNADGMDMAVDSRGRLYVADPGDGRVRVFERSD